VLAIAWAAAVTVSVTVASAVHASPSGVPDPRPSAETAGSAAGVLRLVRRDMTRLVSARTYGIVVAGGALTGLGARIENPDRDAWLIEHPGIDDGSDFGNTYGHAATLAAGTVGLAAAGRLFSNPNLSGASGDLARGLVYPAAITGALKAGVHRTRPDGGRYSFPSGHAAVAFTAAPILASRFGPRVGTLAYLAAATTAMGRIEEHRHYLSDVLFGAAIGLSVGMAVSETNPWPTRVFSPSGVGLGVRF